MTISTGKLVALTGLLSVAACSSPTVPDLNLGSVNSFVSSPTLSGANALVNGIIRGVRDNQMFITENLGQIGREGYGICASCGGLYNELALPINPQSYFLEYQMYPLQYTDLREALILLTALPKIAGMTAQQQAGMTG